MKSQRWAPLEKIWVDEKSEVGTPLKTWVDEKSEVGTPKKPFGLMKSQRWVPPKKPFGLMKSQRWAPPKNLWVDESKRWAPLWVDADSKKCQICVVQMTKNPGTLSPC